MQITQWAFSDEEAEQFKSMEAGLRHVIVRDASYDDASGKYTLDLKDLQDGATARLTYSMFKADDRSHSALTNRNSSLHCSSGAPFSPHPTQPTFP